MRVTDLRRMTLGTPETHLSCKIILIESLFNTTSISFTLYTVMVFYVVLTIISLRFCQRRGEGSTERELKVSSVSSPRVLI